MSLFSEATCLSNIRSHSASRLGRLGAGGGVSAEREGGGTVLEAAGEKRGKKSEEVPQSQPRKGGQQK